MSLRGNEVEPGDRLQGRINTWSVQTTDEVLYQDIRLSNSERLRRPQAGIMLNPASVGVPCKSQLPRATCLLKGSMDLHEGRGLP